MNDGIDDFSALARDIEAWDGSPSTATDLRRRVASIKAVDRPNSAAERNLEVVRKAYERRAALRVERITGTDADGSPRARYFAPFVGDPALGPWPFEDGNIRDATAALWLSVLGTAAPGAAVRRFVTEMLRARSRLLWVPASRCLAELALRDEECRRNLVEGLAAALPHGIPSRWPGAKRDRGGALPDAPKGSPGLANDGRHSTRHLLHLACCYLGRGGRLANFDAAQFMKLTLPAEPADSSVVLLSLLELLGPPGSSHASDWRTAVIDALPARLSEVPRGKEDEQHHEAVRELAARLADAPDGVAVRSAAMSWLAAASWKDAAGLDQLNLLWAWLENARFAAERADEATVAAMRTNAGPASRALAQALGAQEATTPLPERLVELVAIFNDDVRETTSLRSQYIAAVEILLLGQLPEIAPLPWRAIVRRGAGDKAATERLEGCVRDVAMADIVVQFSPTDGGESITMLRRVELPERVVLGLAARNNGFLARQVALQIERMIRGGERLRTSLERRRAEASTGGEQALEADEQIRRELASLAPRALDLAADFADVSPQELHDIISGGILDGRENRVRLLWSLLQQNPHGDLFGELRRMLRGPSDSRLHSLVGAIAEMDALHREKTTDVSSLAMQYEAVAKHVVDILQKEALASGSRNASVYLLGAAAVDALATSLVAALKLNRNEVASEAWCGALETVLFGRDGLSGIFAWRTWLGLPVGELREAFTRLRGTIDSVHEARRQSDLETRHCDELADAVSHLRACLSQSAWPETRMIEALLDALDGFLNERRRDATRIERDSRRVRRLLADRNEEALVDLVHNAPASVEFVSPRLLRELGGFLLRQLRYRDARRLRLAVQGRTPIKSALSFVAPLLIGVTAGAFATIQSGPAWNDVVLKPASTAYVTTLAMSLGASFLLLVSKLEKHRAAPPTAHGSFGNSGRWRHYTSVGLRVLPTYGICFVLALFTSGLVLWTLDGTATRSGSFLWQALLWSGISMFLGMYVGMLAQNQGFVSDGEE